MEIGTQVWCWDKSGHDRDFPGDDEADGVWRTARVSRVEIEEKRLVFTATYTDGAGG